MGWDRNSAIIAVCRLPSLLSNLKCCTLYGAPAAAQSTGGRGASIQRYCAARALALAPVLRNHLLVFQSSRKLAIEDIRAV